MHISHYSLCTRTLSRTLSELEEAHFRIEGLRTKWTHYSLKKLRLSILPGVCDFKKDIFSVCWANFNEGAAYDWIETSKITYVRLAME